MLGMEKGVPLPPCPPVGASSHGQRGSAGGGWIQRDVSWGGGGGWRVGVCTAAREESSRDEHWGMPKRELGLQSPQGV